MSIGIFLGLLAALFQSVSYLCSKLFIVRHNNVALLLSLSHIIMGVLSIPLVLWLAPEDMPAFQSYAGSLAGTAGFYLLGQAFLFISLIKTEASRVSPLLGLKIIILAMISTAFLHQPMGAAKWAAVFFSSLAAFLLSHSGRRIPVSGWTMILLACISYSFSDLNIKRLVEHFIGLGLMHGAMLAAGLTYILCGLFGAVCVIFQHKKLTRETWGYALPFALSWLTAMFFLFACFAVIGVVYGNIVQSARGLISIGLGYAVARMGFERWEPKISRPVLIRRLLAATLMTAAVILFYLGR